MQNTTNQDLLDFNQVSETLRSRISSLDDASKVLKSPELKQLFAQISKVSAESRAEFGQKVNNLKKELEDIARSKKAEQEQLEHVESIDVTAPFDINSGDSKPKLLPVNRGTVHPLTREMSEVVDIFYRMGFEVVESREIDADYHMFETLNFPEGHPARDDYDTFVTIQKDKNDKSFIAPAHTSTMQNRVLRKYSANLQNNEQISVILPGRTFRNEDLDARHEHTFYQLEGVFVGKNVHAGNLIGVFKRFLEEYYQQNMDLKLQPFYFPFTEPSFEFVLSCPFCQKKGCKVCSHAGWIELGGCGMIHPNVLKMADIDPEVYTGFAWGIGIERLVMMKYNIEDIRYFESGKLDFLEQFV
jgi:phenylalanyl-tRNA synthetase alpha chain